MQKINITSEWLYNEYINKQKNITKIANESTYDRVTIRKYIKKFNIPKRTQSEENLLVLSNHVNLSNEAKEFIYGELLGDGHLKSIKHSASFTYSSKYKKYVEWIFNKFKNFDINFSKKIYKDKTLRYINNYKIDNVSFRANTYFYIELLNIHRKWYNNKLKIVPKDLQLTSLMVRQWYIGDGNLKRKFNKKYNKYYYHISLCTNGFTKKETEFLSNLLNKTLNISSIIYKRKDYINKDKGDGYIIYINKQKDINEFLTYIGNIPKEIENIYGYKWI